MLLEMNRMLEETVEKVFEKMERLAKKPPKKTTSEGK